MEETNKNTNICPRCSAGFSCDITQGKESCWCFELPPLQLVSKEAKNCYCSNCIKELLEEENKTHSKNK